MNVIGGRIARSTRGFELLAIAIFSLRKMFRLHPFDLIDLGPLQGSVPALVWHLILDIEIFFLGLELVGGSYSTIKAGLLPPPRRVDLPDALCLSPMQELRFRLRWLLHVSLR